MTQTHIRANGMETHTMPSVYPHYPSELYVVAAHVA